MSYTYPEALNALQSIANEFTKRMRNGQFTQVQVIADPQASTASVSWDATFSRDIRIHLPVRPAATRMTESEFEDWTAYVLHEMGHPTHTDRAMWDNAVRAGLGQLTNAVEDIRMEQAVITSGIVPNAKRVLSRLVVRKMAEARAAGWRPNSRKEIGWTLCVLGRAANGYDIPQADVDWIKSRILPGSTVDKILAWALPEIAAAKTTQHCFDIAAKIAKAIAAPAPQQGPQGRPGPAGAPNGAGQGEQAQDGETSQGPANEAGEGSEGSEGEGSEGDRQQDTGGKSSDGQGGKGHGDGTKTQASDEAPVTNEKDLAQHELSPETEALTGVAAHAAARVIEVLRAARGDEKPDAYMQDNLARTRGSYVIALKNNAARAGKQRAALARALKANEQDERESGRRSGKLDRGALVRAMAGSANVFTKHDVSEGFDTDVLILIDASGSMGGHGMLQAVEAATIAAQAAASVGVSYTIEHFNSHGFARTGSIAGKRAPVIAEMAKVHNAASGGTPLSINMARAAKAQALRAPQKRRVMFIMTDGGCDYGLTTAKQVADYCEKAYGTVFAHVSIGTQLQGAFKAEVMVGYGQSIADVGLGHFAKVLEAL